MENITKIKNQLPHGAQKEIAKKANVHFILVNRVLNGKSDDINIINAIADYYLEYKLRKDKAIERISALV